VISSC